MTVVAFMSYSAHDRQMVLRLRAGLAERGLKVWMDTEDLHGDTPWNEAVQSVIASARVVLLGVSRHWAASEPCSYELACARAEGKPLIAVDVSDTLAIAVLPPGLRKAGVETIDGGGSVAQTIEVLAARLNNPSPSAHP